MADNTEQQLSSSLLRALDGEIRANERALADVRVVYIALSIVFQVVGVVSAGLAVRVPLLTAAGLAVSVGFAVAVRLSRRHEWIGIISPVFDAGFLVFQHWLSFSFLVAAGYGSTALTVPYAMGCLLLASSGALRLTRRRVWWTTGLALLALVGGLLLVNPEFHSGVVRYSAAIVVVMGVLATRISGVAQRAVRSELAKQVLKKFLPSEVVQSAHYDPLSLLVPRTVDVTVLFTDLRGFTAMAEKMSAAEVMSFLSQLHGVASEVIYAQGGTIDKFTGDGLLAVFGAMQSDQPHAAQAVKAALELRARMAQVNATRAASGGTPLAIGIGVHSGSVVTGSLGSAERLEFTVVGDTVNIASRLEALTKERGVDLLISEETARRSPQMALVEVGEAQLRGRDGLVRLYTAGQGKSETVTGTVESSVRPLPS